MKFFLLESTVVWAVLLGFFELFLRRQTHFRLNRIWLVGAGAAGLLLPFLREAAAAFFEANALPTVALPVFDFSQNADFETEKAAAEPPLFSIEKALLAAWAVGAMVGLGRLAAGLLELKSWAEKGAISSLGEGLFLIETTAKDAVPCSFFKLIFLPNSLTINELERQQLLAHERAHALGGHSREVLFAEVLAAVFWFQPLVFWLKNRLREAHEFEADRAAADLFSKKQYGQLLLRAASDGLADRQTGRGLPNPFFTITIKNRIAMLVQQKSSATSRWRYFAALPICVAALFFQPKTVVAQMAAAPEKAWSLVKRDTLIIFSPDTYFESLAYAEDRKMPSGAVEQSVFYVKIDTMPEFPGGQTALLNYLVSSVRYPAEARKAGQQGKVLVQFIVEKDGSLTEIELAKTPPGPTLGDEALRVVQAMPRWRPGKHSFTGEQQRVRMVLPILFRFD